MDKEELLENKIRKAIEQLTLLRRENTRLQSECDTLKAHVEMLSVENTKAQRILAQYDHLRRTHEQVTHRVEKALSKLATLAAPAEFQ